MKMFSILLMTLATTTASANLGGYNSGYALRGSYECGPKEGVSVKIDMQAGEATIIGRTEVPLELVGGGPSNGNAYYKFQGLLDGKTISMSFESLMGAKIVKFTHPSGKAYQMSCNSAKRSQQGF